MRTWGKVATAVGLLLLAGLVYYLRLDSLPNDRGSQRSYGAHLMCRACGHDWVAKLNSEKDRYPQQCEKCGKSEAWPMYHCYSCNADFAPEPEGNPPHVPVVPICPKCKSPRVGGVPVKN